MKKEYAIEIKSSDGSQGFYKPGFNPVPKLQATRYPTRVDADRIAGMLQHQYRGLGGTESTFTVVRVEPLKVSLRKATGRLS